MHAWMDGCMYVCRYDRFCVGWGCQCGGWELTFYGCSSWLFKHSLQRRIFRVAASGVLRFLGLQALGV